MLTRPEAIHPPVAEGPDAFAGAGGLLLAVSGGPDSMGMLFSLARAGASSKNDRRIEVATVDHGLRPESSSEASMVAAACAGLGLVHHTLHIETPPKRGVQANARHMRYRLLAACARERGLKTIVTAHHAGDQAETVAMRLAHRSGLEGLAGIRRHSNFDGIGILRPFLDLAPEQLRAFAADGPSVDDPSNRDRRFERVRVRQALDDRSRTRLLRLGARASELRTRRELARHQAILSHCRLLPSGHAAIPLAALASMSPLLRAGLIGDLVPAIAGSRHRPPFAARTRFLERTVAEKGATLAGCRAVVRNGNVWLGREWGRTGPEPVLLTPGRSAVWDERFVCVAPEALPVGSTLDALGDDKDRMPHEIPAVLRRAAPAIRYPDGTLFEGPAEVEWLGFARLAQLAGQSADHGPWPGVYAN
ncbi:MAG: tRNA lysidine(34) synthetase TilS [Rhodobiaceae bacterium]|nr:tRNA lysidine(34) synthetase TilS [Rhodobiaceae bacterium]MCC0057272.1 tRNA lysidine(34) synthetase TilS [Rhodobiaceae bacterium]